LLTDKQMEENLTETQETEKKSKFRLWIENFWYHYKWHSIVALFLVFTVTICSVQMCKKEDFDIYILYGGGKYISRQTEDGNFCEYDTMNSSFKQITKDYDGDGKINVSFLDKYMLSDEEIREAGEDVNHQFLYQNNEAFRDLMFASPYYICLLTDKLYLEYAKNEGIFCPLAQYANGTELNYLDEGAVYLNSENLAFGKLPGICDLPENTVICLKAKTAVSSYFGNKENAAHFERSVESIKAIFAYGK